MDYTQLSDFEINKRVAKALGHSIDDQRYGFASIGVFHSDGIAYKSYDYCNNPADAWPIMVDNQISILYEEAMGKWNAGKAYWVDGVEWQITDDVMDKNPLRAAMLVFLMMQAAKHG